MASDTTSSSMFFSFSRAPISHGEAPKDSEKTEVVLDPTLGGNNAEIRQKSVLALEAKGDAAAVNNDDVSAN